MPQIDQGFLDALGQLKGKLVKVRMKISKEVESSQEAPGFFYADYTGVVLDPPVRKYPENAPEGEWAFFIQANAEPRRIYALAVASIDEVDDEVGPESAPQVAMSALSQ